MNNPILLGIKQHPFYFLLVLIGFFTFLFFPEGLFFIAGSVAFIIWLKETYEYRKINNFQVVTKEKPKADQFMSHEEKQEYLSSDKWKVKKVKIHLRDRICQSCGSNKKLVVHHIRYDNLGNEPLEDLVLLCNSCHEELHNELGYSRTQTFNIKGS